MKGLANLGPPKEDGSEEGESSDLHGYPGLEAAAISIIESHSTKKEVETCEEKCSNGRIIFLTALDRYISSEQFIIE